MKVAASSLTPAEMSSASELRDQAVERLLVGEEGRDGDAARERQLRVAGGAHGAEQAHGDRRGLGGEADRVRLAARLHHVAGERERGHGQHHRHQHQRRCRASLRQPGSRALPYSANRTKVRTPPMPTLPDSALLLLALDPDERADQDRGEQAPDETRVERARHGASASGAGGTGSTQTGLSTASRRPERARLPGLRVEPEEADRAAALVGGDQHAARRVDLEVARPAAADRHVALGREPSALRRRCWKIAEAVVAAVRAVDEAPVGRDLDLGGVARAL